MFGFPWSEKEPARRLKPFGPRVEQLETREVPAVIAVGDNYLVRLGSVLTVPATRSPAVDGPGPVGVLANDFSDQFPGTQLTASRVGVAKYVSPNGVALPVLPTGSQPTLNPDGSFTFVAPSSVPPAARALDGSVRVTFQYIANDVVNQQSSAPATVTITLQDTTTRLIAVGPESGAPPIVNVFQSGSGIPNLNFPSIQAYESSFTAGVRVAVGDVNQDGVDDIITIPAVSGGARVRAFDGRNGAILADFFAFDPAFRGGGYVAVGDFTGSGSNDSIVGAGEGGGPRVQVYQVNPIGANGLPTGVTQITNFFAYEPAARNGVRVAAGDVKGIGRDAIITAPGNGGGPRVRVFDRTNVLAATGLLPGQVGQVPTPAGGAAVSSLDFFATDGTNRAGVYIAAGNVGGNGRASIVTGTGSGAAIVRIFDGVTGGLTREFTVPNDELPAGGGTTGGPGNFALQGGQTGTLLAPSLAPSSLVPTGTSSLLGVNNPRLGALTGGARVATTDYNGDGLDEILVAGGAGVTPRVRVFDPRNNTQLTSILAFDPAFLGGINIAAN